MSCESIYSVFIQDQIYISNISENCENFSSPTEFDCAASSTPAVLTAWRSGLSYYISAYTFTRSVGKGLDLCTGSFLASVCSRSSIDRTCLSRIWLHAGKRPVWRANTLSVSKLTCHICPANNLTSSLNPNFNLTSQFKPRNTGCCPHRLSFISDCQGAVSLQMLY